MKSLKRQNRLPLAAVLAGNLAAFSAVARGDSLLTGLSHKSGEALRELIPAGGAALVVGLLNNQISANAKARLVFMRWNNPLPGARAFSHYLRSDPRIDVKALASKLGPFPSAPGQQNALWYKLYRSVEAEASVRDAHQHFLFSRDYATMMLLLAIALTPVAEFLTRAPKPVIGLLAFFAFQFVLAARAARTQGERLVCNVLALKSSEEDPAK